MLSQVAKRLLQSLHLSLKHRVLLLRTLLQEQLENYGLGEAILIEQALRNKTLPLPQSRQLVQLNPERFLKLLQFLQALPLELQTNNSQLQEQVLCLNLHQCSSNLHLFLAAAAAAAAAINHKLLLPLLCQILLLDLLQGYHHNQRLSLAVGPVATGFLSQLNHRQRLLDNNNNRNRDRNNKELSQ